MIKKVRLFETYETTPRFTEPGSKKIDVVIQTGGKNAKVKYHVIGYEAMLNMWIWTHLTPKGLAMVFDNETKKLLGYISLNEHQCPVKYLEPEELYFNDMYQPA